MQADADAMDIAAGFLTDSSQEVRLAARGLLRGDLLGSRAIEILEQLASNESEGEDLRRFAIQALGRSPQEAAVVALFNILQPRGLLESSATTALRDQAAVALRSSPSRAGPAQFAQGLKSSVWRVRKACERASRSSHG
jgi:HEAT repeat protein